MINYFVKQFEQVAKGGWSVFFQKLCSLIKKLFMDIPLYVIAIPLVVFVRFFRPFVLIRFGSLHQSVIGDFAFDTESYLSERELKNDSSLDLFWYKGNYLSNKQWKIMAERNLKIYPFVKYLDKINDFILAGNKHKIIIRPSGVLGASSRDYKDVFYHTKPHIKFTKDEIDRGNGFLRDIGIDSDEKFVCIIVRDHVYKENYQKHVKSDWSYHSNRNSDIQKCSEAALYLANNGYWVFRMGKGVESRFNHKHEKIIDYASSDFRSDFLDIYLFSKCYFCLAGLAGVHMIAHVYRKPVCQINVTQIEYLLGWHDNNLLIFKKYWLKNENRFMTFKEIYKSGSGRVVRTDEFENRGIKLIENTPEEIFDVSQEMFERLNGTWEPAPEDEELQSAFRALYPKDEYTSVLRARIGAKFLRQNQQLLIT